ncbi:hypothetical protein TrRE_jg2206, partial [Triparma retinervis]
GGRGTVRVWGGRKADRERARENIEKVWGDWGEDGGDGGDGGGLILTVCDLGEVESGGAVRDWCGNIRGEGGRNAEAYLGEVVRRWMGGARGGMVDVAVGTGEEGVEVRVDFGGGGDGGGKGMEGMWREIKGIMKRAGKQRRRLGHNI